MKVVRYFSIFLLVINVVFLRLIYLNLSKSLEKKPPSIEKPEELSSAQLEVSEIEISQLELSSGKENLAKQFLITY